MATLRSPQVTQKYKEHRRSLPERSECELCTKPALTQFTYWKIADNLFPYDTIASVHHMLISLRHVNEDAFSPEEIKEFNEIKRGYVAENYDWLIEATPKNKSIPAHYHLQLLVGKA